MRRMDYNRFAKPYNFGEWNTVQSKFTLEKTIEKGLYLCTIHEAANDVDITSIIDVVNNEQASSSTAFYYPEEGKLCVLNVYFNNPNDSNMEVLDYEGNAIELPSDSTILMYKLN